MPRKANVDNLIPANKQSKEEARENGRKGGKASGKARREKKALKQTLETLMKMPIHSGAADDLDEIMSLAEVNGKNITAQEAIVIAQLKKALAGDPRSATILIELLKMTQDKEQEAGVQIIDDF